MRRGIAASQMRNLVGIHDHFSDTFKSEEAAKLALIATVKIEIYIS